VVTFIEGTELASHAPQKVRVQACRILLVHYKLEPHQCTCCVYCADQRYYSPGFGRFMSADPSGHANPLDPTSWNHIAYVSAVCVA
jgi:RHS repeat-associated protein